MKQPDFLHVDTNLLKLKVDQKFFGWAWVWPVGTLKLTVSQEQTDGINRFFLHAGAISGKPKVILVIFR